MKKYGIGLMVMGLLAGSSVLGAGVSGLSGTYRDGQVFLTWQEKELPESASLRVYSHVEQITEANLDKARLLAEHIHVGSARDWWRDRASFGKGNESSEPVGFVIETGGAELDPKSGLHVHTVDAAGNMYYAVTWLKDGVEQRQVVLGGNSLKTPLSVKVAQRNIVWLGDASKAPKAGSGYGKALFVSLHGRGGGVPRDTSRAAFNSLYFADKEEGWREGLPFKFQLQIHADRVVIAAQERIWVNRPVLESPDGRDHCPTAQSFWFGYNEKIYKKMGGEPIVVKNYMERYLNGLLDWAQNYLGTDVNRTYFSGGSMGGSGSVSMALHFPKRIAAVRASVPIYSYTWKRCGRVGPSGNRLICSCGPINKVPAKLWNGGDILEYMDGAKNIAVSADMPPIFATNGRQDMSIPWVNNPPFYKAANDAKQAFAVFWNNGDHGMSSQAPRDVKDWERLYRKYRLDMSYPAFSNNSDNKDYGDGDPAKGDLVGWINRGMDWELHKDELNDYSMTVTAKHPDIKYPVTFDVTFRRLQKFKVKAGDVLQVKIGEEQRQVTVGSDGLLTVTGVCVSSPRGVRIDIKR